MKKNHRKYILKTIELCIYVLVAYFIYQKLGGNIAQISFDDIDVKYLVIAVVIFTTHSIWNGLTWNYMIRSSGEKTVTDEQISVYLRSYIMRYIPGNVVGILSRGILNKEHGIPVLKSIWGWFLENILYLGIGIILGLFALRVIDLDQILIYTLMAVTILVGVFVLLKHDFLEDVFNKYLRPRLPKKYQGEARIMSLSLKSRILLGLRFLISWSIYSVSYLFVVKAAGVTIGDDWMMYIAINAIAYAIGYLTLITPSGIGVREGVMIFLLGEAVGLPAETSVIIAVLARIVFILGELVGFALFYIYKFTKNAIKRT